MYEIWWKTVSKVARVFYTTEVTEVFTFDCETISVGLRELLIEQEQAEKGVFKSQKSGCAIWMISYF